MEFTETLSILAENFSRYSWQNSSVARLEFVSSLSLLLFVAINLKSVRKFLSVKKKIDKLIFGLYC